MNAPSAVATAYAALNGVHGLFETTNVPAAEAFDSAAVLAGYHAVIEHAISRVSEVNDYYQTYVIPDFAANGIQISHETE
ncbi:hypothetical protein ACC691_38995, partial [Rhizobium johnstonii]|uniref:hypothetical protein n=1 Tax=Rhizobium johnstonii TaxID=3019933 RepID=UPI003F9A7AAD